jgi:LacI family transcriptional regulator
MAPHAVTTPRVDRAESRTVLLALGWYDHRLLRGIGMYAAEHNWHLAAASITQELTIPWGWQGDGILAWLGGNDELAEFVVSEKRPTVDFSLRRMHLPFAHVALDHKAAAEMAAEHLLQRGFRNFLFYSASDNWTFEERGSGFIGVLRKHGHQCAWHKWHLAKRRRRGRSEWAERRLWLAKVLKAASKPAAIFTANGTLALEVQEVCNREGIGVPLEVAIVGIEDDLLLPQSMLRSITAVDPNLEEQGYQGAALLDRLMGGESPPPQTIRIPPARIITRQSTEITAVVHPGVAKAVRFIAANLDKTIDIEAVARHAGMSRRGLHQAFVEHMGRTPGTQIRTVRIEHARKLLAETDSKIEEIALLSGYQSMNSFFVAFKQACKITPAEFRKEVRRARD